MVTEEYTRLLEKVTKKLKGESPNIFIQRYGEYLIVQFFDYVTQIHNDYVTQSKALLINLDDDTLAGEVTYIYTPDDGGETSVYSYDDKLNRTQLLDIFDRAL